LSGAAPVSGLFVTRNNPDLRAGLLASGSAYYLRLPIPLKWDSGFRRVRPRSQRRDRDGFPSSPLNPEGYPDGKIVQASRGAVNLYAGRPHRSYSSLAPSSATPDLSPLISVMCPEMASSLMRSTR
jgi:hypothetical protein